MSSISRPRTRLAYLHVSRSRVLIRHSSAAGTCVSPSAGMPAFRTLRHVCTLQTSIMTADVPVREIAGLLGVSAQHQCEGRGESESRWFRPNWYGGPMLTHFPQAVPEIPVSNVNKAAEYYVNVL